MLLFLCVVLYSTTHNKSNMNNNEQQQMGISDIGFRLCGSCDFCDSRLCYL